MDKHRSLARYFTAIFAASIFAFAINAQPSGKTPETDPSKKPIKAKSEPDKALKNFLLDVKYIITPRRKEPLSFSKLLRNARNS